MSTRIALLCPGQGAQAVGMGAAWASASSEARAVFEEADAVLGDSLGPPLSRLCFEGPADALNRTDAAQPAIYTCSVASARALAVGSGGDSYPGDADIVATAGLSLGEYTALHLAGVFDFATGLRLVALRGRLMQHAAENSQGGMVALTGAEPEQAEKLCADVRAAMGTNAVLVPANYNAPGQIVISGSRDACTRAAELAGEAGLRATPLQVAGAFHSALMDPATGPMREALGQTALATPAVPVWSNVTAEPHPNDAELLRQRLVEQIVSPVRWAQTAQSLAGGSTIEVDEWHELAPGSVLRGLMRRTNRNAKVTSHDQP